jgi:hypothetical protein
MNAAGVNADSPQEFEGRALITITLGRYGHQVPGSDAEAPSVAGA